MPARILQSWPELKIAGAGVVAMFTGLADAMSNAPAASWESYGLKGVLLVAVAYLARENAIQRKEHKREMAAERKCSEERERKMEEVLMANTIAKEGNTAAMLKLAHSTDQQTEYYRAVARTILNREIHPKLPQDEPGD